MQDENDRKIHRKTNLEQHKKNQKNTDVFSEDLYYMKKQTKHYKQKKKEIQADELWDDWESGQGFLR
jgi:hypothetical protein